MDVKDIKYLKYFYKYFRQFAYKKYIYIGIFLLFLRYGLGFNFFNLNTGFQIFLALLIYELPSYNKFKHYENNKIYRYRDLIEIFTSIISVLNLAYRGYWISTDTNVGYHDLTHFKQQCASLSDFTKQKEDINFKVINLCNKDFQSLKYIHSPFFEKYCLCEDLRDTFLDLASDVTKLERDVDLILNPTLEKEQSNCIENFHFQVMNICSEMENLYKSFLDEVEANIPVKRNTYFRTMFGG